MMHSDVCRGWSREYNRTTPSSLRSDRVPQRYRDLSATTRPEMEGLSTSECAYDIPAATQPVWTRVGREVVMYPEGTANSQLSVGDV